MLDNSVAEGCRRTRACQDGARLMADTPLLVTTDPLRMVAPLVAKDGPAERRARREAGEAVQVLRGMSRRERSQRILRSNLLGTAMGYRIRRLEALANRAGPLFRTPGHEGTTAGCPACDRVRSKVLPERLHCCSCGMVLPRDQASALETLGRALPPFRLSPDPGGAIAAMLAERAVRERKTERARAVAATRRETTTGAARPPGHPDTAQARARAGANPQEDRATLDFELRHA